MAEEQAQKESTQEAVQQAPAAEAPQLSIADLQALLNVIDVASSRGAFRANELTNVGGIADKLTKFLQHVADQQKAQADAKSKTEAEGGAIDEGKIGDAQPNQEQPEQK
jgi:hypothetical protein|tara:strand:- start:360 stop:686 length:327 start_codon:yes stop_codon:yes gene_type:complete